MRAGYIIEADINDLTNFIIVSNYLGLNEIHNWGCENEKELENLKKESDIGFWRIKRKETIK